MVCEIGCYGAALVGRDWEDVGEAAAGVDDCFAGFLGGGDGGAGDNLCGPD